MNGSTRVPTAFAAALAMILCSGGRIALAQGPNPALGTPASVRAALGGGAPDSKFDEATPDDPLIVEVWTFGPGDHPFTRFGHNALRIVDRRALTDRSYNFGTFHMASEHLIGDFLQSRLRYWLSTAPTGAMARSYQRENRSIEIQRLALTTAQKRQLAENLDRNALPENRDYRYDYFRDNCSTRVRDSLDAVLSGQLHEFARRPGDNTLRNEALRMTAAEPWLYVALLIVLGPSTDQPLDRWGETFLPGRLQQVLRELRVGADGHSLVAAEQTAFVADREPVRTAPPRWGLWFFLVGIASGGLFFMLGRQSRRNRLLRVTFGIGVALVGLVVGALGCFLLGSWALTPHVAVYRNQNLFLLPPFALALGVLGLGAAFGRIGAMQKLARVCLWGFTAATLAIAVKILPALILSNQANGALIAAMWPLWLGLTLGARSLVVDVKGRARSST